MVIRQGDLFWARLASVEGSEPSGRRPVIVMQRDSINRSKFNTVLIVPLTSQTRHSHLPGNVRLQKGEANIPRTSLARCTHLMVLDKARLIEKIGTLNKDRVDEILKAVCWVVGR